MRLSMLPRPYTRKCWQTDFTTSYTGRLAPSVPAERRANDGHREKSGRPKVTCATIRTCDVAYDFSPTPRPGLLCAKYSSCIMQCVRLTTHVAPEGRPHVCILQYVPSSLYRNRHHPNTPTPASIHDRSTVVDVALAGTYALVVHAQGILAGRTFALTRPVAILT